MSRRDRAAKIAAILEDRFPAPAIPLTHEDPFGLLVAVVLSAQTTDARVNQVTPALMARAPTPQAMAALPEREILRHIKSCGLAPAKAKNLRALSKLIVERHGGEVPRTFDELEALPGVGHKTASVVMAQAFGVPAFPVDTHIHRLAGRWGLSRARNVEEVERDLKAVFPEDRWNLLHLQIIYFGRSFCPARGHDVTACPICSWAMSRAKVAAERRVPRPGPGDSARSTRRAEREAPRRRSTGRSSSPRQRSDRRWIVDPADQQAPVGGPPGKVKR